MRIAIAGIAHETNTFCRDQTALDDFRVLRGDAILDSRGEESSLGGFVDACADAGIEPVGILCAGTQPSGIIARTAYQALKQEIVDGMSAAGHLDGVVLALHGAGVVDGIDDLEADLAAAVRAAVGPDLPIVATFDLHGNISQAMANSLDGVLACRHYPHVDMHERSRDAVALIQRIQAEAIDTVTHVETVPVALPTTTTFFGIGKTTLERMVAAQNDEVVDVSWFHGFPYADTPLVASTVVVTTTGDRQTAAATAKNLAHELWQQRQDFVVESLGADEAVRQALAAVAEGGDGPVVINETSDNCGGGSPGDGTHLLRAMLNANLTNACFGFIVDPEVAAAAHAAGTGATLAVSLGGKYDDMHGAPIELTNAYVKALADGDLVLQAMGRGSRLRLGPMARLVIDGIDVVVATNRSQTFDAEPFLAVGIDINRYDIVALKSSNHFRGYFQDRARAIVTADPPGMTTLRVDAFERNRAPKLWPMHADADYTP